LVTSGLVIGVAAVVVTGTLLSGSLRQTAPEPSSPATPTGTAAPPAANGPISSAGKHFGVAHDGYDWRAFDAAGDRGLYVWRPGCDSPCPEKQPTLVVVAPGRQLASLGCTCPQGRLWLDRAATLGPGPAELTVPVDGRRLRVVAYDGTVHRTLDLRRSLAPDESITRSAWSADGHTLAVVTGQVKGGGGISRVWLVDTAGRARLAYALTNRQGEPEAPGLDGTGGIATLNGWSPDGSALLLDVRPRPTEQYGSHVVVLRMQPDGAPRPAKVQTLYRSDRHFDWANSLAWSPDGTRIAVRTQAHIVEISAVDGRLLASRPPHTGWLLWPRADG
jgi:Tol biopolymer transport system component